MCNGLAAYKAEIIEELRKEVYRENVRGSFIVAESRFGMNGPD